VAQDILGLQVMDEVDGRVYLTAGGARPELIYIPSDVDAIDHVALRAPNDDAVRAARDRLVSAGRTIITDEPLEGGVDSGFTVAGPEGYAFSVYTAADSETPRSAGGATKRLGHINLHPSDVAGAKRFFVDELGFMVSDAIGADAGYFLRCNTEHHAVGLIKGRGTMHHHAWQLRSLADLAELADRLDRTGRRLIWGPLRHGAGRNIAAYFVEPTGAVIEIYTDMDHIYDDTRPPIVWPEGDDGWINRWGVYRGENFRDHGIPAASALARRS
jgi:catechol-2,3-dioxygenase